ncbi:MAG: diguanylate cyclase [Elusimicrobiota bacterium]
MNASFNSTNKPSQLRLNFWALQMYTECPLKYKFHYIESAGGLGTLYHQERPFLSFDESIHKTLAKFFKLKTASYRTLKTLHNLLKDNWLSKGYISKEEEADWKSQANSLLERFSKTFDIKLQPYLVDEYFEIPIGEDGVRYTLFGTIDRVDEIADGEGGYEIIDYKTRRTLFSQKEVEDDLQLAIFQLACAKKFNIVANKLSIMFLNFDKKMTVTKPAENIKHTETKILQIANKIKTDTEFNPTPNPYCNVCDYNVICPAMGIGLEIVRTLDKEDSFRKTIGHLEMIRNDLYALHKASNELAGILEVPILTEKIINIFVELAKVEKGLLCLINDEGKFAPKVSVGLEGIKIDKLCPPDGCKLKVRSAEIINDMYTDDRFRYLITKISDIQSAIILPLIVAESIEGILILMNKKNKTKFNNYDLVFLNNLSDSAAIALHNAQLYELAITDGLTKLYIHRYFQTRLESELIRAKRYNSNISLLMLDIDHFKKINDTYGHQEGDYVLKKFARILMDNIRKVDIPVRYGGEEFTIILPETGLAGAEQVAEHLRCLVEQEDFIIDTKRVPVTTSVGVACWDKIASKEEFIEQSDKALYQAKHEGRNRVCKFLLSQ